jgi:hypothetical protein
MGCHLSKWMVLEMIDDYDNDYDNDYTIDTCVQLVLETTFLNSCNGSIIRFLC